MSNNKDSNKSKIEEFADFSSMGRSSRGRGTRGLKGPKPKNMKGTLKRLWEYFQNERKLLVILFICVIIYSLVTLLVPYIIGKSIDSMSKGKDNVDFSYLKVTIISLIIAYIINGVLTIIQGLIMAKVSQSIVKNLRKTLFEKLQKLPLAFFDSNSHGDIMSRLTNDIDNISSVIAQSTTELMSGTITILGSIIMMIILSIPLTLGTLIIVPLIFLLTKSITRKTRVLFKEQQIILGKLNGHIEESISGINIVKAFNHEEKSIYEFEKINKDLYNVGVKAQIRSGFLMPMMNVINNIGFTMVALIGGILATKDIITLGVIASFLSYSRQFSRPLNDLANIFNSLQSGVAGAERVFNILDEEEETLDSKGAEALINPKGEVEFSNVTFGYGEDSVIFNNISFYAKPGSSTAIVGPTGAGKTTIVNLLTRFYEINKGEILIDGKNIKSYTRDSLRKTFGIVLQDTYLFSGTIKENIKYGSLNATDEEVYRAAKMANAHRFISHLKDGYETVLTESGANLSQGQRQLIAIARAILSNPSILILDEATSSVDTRTELQIQDAMVKLMGGRTTFIIAHRLSTIRNANNIMLIDKGIIKESGSHEELIAKRGEYYNMYFNQFKGLVEY
ncbi:ABC transporter ATP-binding protein [Clostridium hydrogeniformans]|uniref:ABC transporter ATP-binding protein n=1 Tax=Clostridium hydrogeniformans TaxID=349933 RepID=UPI00068E7F07